MAIEDHANDLTRIVLVEDHAPSWVELYPACGAHSVVSVLGERSAIEEIELSELLSILDRAKRSPHPG